VRIRAEQNVIMYSTIPSPSYRLMVYNSRRSGFCYGSNDLSAFLGGFVVSKKWRSVAIIAFVVGGISIIAGFVLSRIDSFLENILAGIAVSAFTFAIAILLIEGPVLTRERRLQKVISITTRRLAQLNKEIGMILAREIGEYLASKLDSNIDLYGEERDNWTDFKRLLRSVFQDARQVPIKGLPKSEPLSEEDYLCYVKGARSFMERVRSAIGSDWEIQAQLLELLEHWNRLDANIKEAGYPYNIEDEKMRYATLAAIGDTLIDLVEACPKIKD